MQVVECNKQNAFLARQMMKVVIDPSTLLVTQYIIYSLESFALVIKLCGGLFVKASGIYTLIFFVATSSRNKNRTIRTQTSDEIKK
jgi:hypothetical protein